MNPSIVTEKSLTRLVIGDKSEKQRIRNAGVD